jgi:transposase
MTYQEVTRRFRVSNSTILRWVRRLREHGHYAALPMGGMSAPLQNSPKAPTENSPGGLT